MARRAAPTRAGQLNARRKTPAVRETDLRDSILGLRKRQFLSAAAQARADRALFCSLNETTLRFSD
jgi:hypothetical protein